MDKAGWHVSWWVLALAALLVIAALGYREVTLSAKVLGVFLILELATLFLMMIATFVRGGASGVNVHGFSLHDMGSGAPGIVFLLAFACFVGFEATTLFGEEARDRHRTIPRATYLAVIVIGLFYTGVMWTFQVGYGSSVGSAATKDPANFIFNLNTRYVGSWSTEIMQWLVVTSIFAACLSMHSALSRYLFALGRDDVLPAPLGRAHRIHRSPHIASHAQSVVTMAIVAAFALAHQDPYLALYSWLVGVGAVAILVLYAISSFAVCFVLRRTQRETRVVVTTVAPVIAGLAMAYFVWLAIHNYAALTGSTAGLVNHLYLLVPVVAAIGGAVSGGKSFDLTAISEVLEEEVV